MLYSFAGGLKKPKKRYSLCVELLVKYKDEMFEISHFTSLPTSGIFNSLYICIIVKITYNVTLYIE